MIRLNMIVEGQTEEAFVNALLLEHLIQFNIQTSVRRVKTGSQKGGDPKFARVKREAELWLKQDPASYLTIMVDLYKLPTDYPGYQDSLKLQAPSRVEALEAAMAQTINHPRFIPYIQLHEFETLLFSDPAQFDWEFMEHEEAIQSLIQLAAMLPPETINDTPEGAPSKRIISALVEYKSRKATAGPNIARHIGLEKIRQRCPHFDRWVSTLEQLKQDKETKL